MNIRFKTGIELAQYAAGVATEPAQFHGAQDGPRFNDPIKFHSIGDMDAEEHDGKMIARELAPYTGTYDKKEAERIVAKIFGKGETEYLQDKDAYEVLRFLAHWV